MRYAPEFFNRADVEEARGVILTPGGGMGTEERWVKETDWLAQRIFFPGRGLVIDYGCGIGRVSKVLNRPVLGVDISVFMLRHAVEYVNRTDFVGALPDAFKAMVDAGLRADGAIAIWSLQHVHDLEKAIYVLMTGIKPGGLFWLLDLCLRNVPAMDKNGDLTMLNDRKDVLAQIEPWCTFEDAQKLDIWPEDPGTETFLRRFRRRG